MKRRSFFQWLSSTVLAFVAPGRVRAQVGAAQMRELAAVVLPESLGRARTDEAADKFARWMRDYRPGAEMACGYGFPRAQTVPASPAANYTAQLSALEAAASAKGTAFSKLNAAAKKAIVEAALQAVKVDRVPVRPNGQHVASDLMSYFYNSSEGQDFLYGVAIKRDDCRGLATSADRPKPI
ncbi:MAG: hypothetical protein JWP63_1955 [Candidatus Solibacter sp.]|nr:hypothetical protein [Candidatus Solibacter sp.]